MKPNAAENAVLMPSQIEVKKSPMAVNALIAPALIASQFLTSSTTKPATIATTAATAKAIGFANSGKNIAPTRAITLPIPPNAFPIPFAAFLAIPGSLANGFLDLLFLPPASGVGGVGALLFLPPPAGTGAGAGVLEFLPLFLSLSLSQPPPQLPPQLQPPTGTAPPLPPFPPLPPLLLLAPSKASVTLSTAEAAPLAPPNALNILPIRPGIPTNLEASPPTPFVSVPNAATTPPIPVVMAPNIISNGPNSANNTPPATMVPCIPFGKPAKALATHSTALAILGNHSLATSNKISPTGSRACCAVRKNFCHFIPNVSSVASATSSIEPLKSFMAPVVPSIAYIASDSKSSHLVPNSPTPIWLARTWSSIAFNSPTTVLATSDTVALPSLNFFHIS